MRFFSGKGPFRVKDQAHDSRSLRLLFFSIESISSYSCSASNQIQPHQFWPPAVPAPSILPRLLHKPLLLSHCLYSALLQSLPHQTVFLKPDNKSFYILFEISHLAKIKGTFLIILKTNLNSPWSPTKCSVVCILAAPFHWHIPRSTVLLGNSPRCLLPQGFCTCSSLCPDTFPSRYGNL